MTIGGNRMVLGQFEYRLGMQDLPDELGLGIFDNFVKPRPAIHILYHFVHQFDPGLVYGSCLGVVLMLLDSFFDCIWVVLCRAKIW